MSNVPYSSATPAAAAIVDRDEILYLNERTKVFRLRFADGTGSLICKQPLGPKAATRLRHERRILERLTAVQGVLQPVAGAAALFANAIVFADGGFISLADAAQGKRFEIPALLALMLQLTDIIAAVHRAGVVHKDISPANILLSGPEHKPLLIDFDLATTFAEERPGFIQPQEIAGTLAYIAPEQTGRSGRSVDQRVDLYSLGAVFYELTVGHPPFDDNHDDPLQLIHQILAQAPVPPAELDLRVPKALSDILLRLLEKEPDRRYQSAEGLKADLLRLREMLARGESGTFPLGEHDYPQRLSPPSRLVGREQEIGILQAAFDNALHGRGNSVLVSGAPGVGKSALINELRPIVTARRGWFVAGKFDQYRQDVAADATGQVLRALVRLMLAEPEAELVVLRERVLNGLGLNAGLMAAALPEFAASFGVAPEVATGDPIQTAKRMIQAGLDLLRVIASPQRPLVMIIDDLQWATFSPLDFIDAIVTDDSLRGLLLVGSYRESGVDAAHPLSALLSRWERLQGAPMQLHLDSLPPDGLATLLAEMLRLPKAQASQLAEAVGARTGGNPFDTVELINALRHDGALILSEDGWRWEAATIRRYVGKGEVIDLLTARIARLPAPAHAMMECMACLGGEVELDRLAAASGLSVAEVEAQLAPALEDGLLVMESSDNTLRFRHDRVQQATYAGLDAAARSAWHIVIARRFATLPEFAAASAEQYLSAIDAIDDNEERGHAVGLLHVAATYARRATNYVLAERFLAAALTLLGMLGTKEEIAANNALSITLETELHAVLYSLGRLDEGDTIYRAIERSSTDPLAFVDATSLQLSSMVIRGRQREALDLGLDMLRRLELEMPPDIGAAMMQRLDLLTRGIGEIDPGAAPGGASDPYAIGQAKLIEKMVAAAMVCDPTLYAWLCLESQRLWIERGPSAELMLGIGSIPVLLIALRGDYRAAYATAQRILAAGEAQGYQEKTALVRSTFAAVIVSFWFEPLEECVEQAQVTREILLQAGELAYASYSYYDVLLMLDCAPTLDNVSEENEAGFALAERTGNLHSNVLFVICRRLIAALRGIGEIDPGAAPGSFTDSAFDETRYPEQISANPMNLALFHICRALSAALFGDSISLGAHIDAAKPLLAAIPGFYLNALAHLLQALALAQRIKDAASEQRMALLAEFDTCRDWIAARAADAPMNFLHLLKWIDAERAWATGDESGAARAFDHALCEAESCQRPWHRALITERAGLFHLAHGLEHAGRSLITEARHLYEGWGASAKVQDLARRHDFLRGGSGQRRKKDKSGSDSISVDGLDLIGILRASQALSSETSIARLRLRINELVCELTGATFMRGVMWYDESQEWCLPPLEAEGENGKPVPVEEAGQRGLLALSAFNYVIRTREPLLVDDALRDDRFARDPYFAGVEHCSLLGVPIFNQGVLRFVLVIENRLSHGAFTVDRLEAVNLIAGQLVISIDNVQLYASLERKVAERTLALEEANQRLAALSITDALTGLANRRRFNEVFEAEWHRAIRPQTLLGVAMIDIDQFKLYNDHYGHQGGDECLRKVAAALQTSVRGDTDLVARYGGEEFVLVLPNADLAASHAVAERARIAVAALNEPHEKAGHGIVTISVGIASMVPTAESDAEHLIELADAALYRAKKNGRNQVVGRRED